MLRIRSVFRGPPILPAPVDLWPALAFEGESVAHSAAAVRDALMRIREGALFWPVPRDDASEAETARVIFRSGRWRLPSGASLSTIRPDRLRGIEGVGKPKPPFFALLAGLEGSEAQACDLLARSVWRCPWTGRLLSIQEGVEALSFLHARASENAVRITTFGLSGWKRRAVAPFLTGPHGRPCHGPANAAPPGGQTVRWGPGGSPADLRMEDGFLRSVGLGVRHTPPASLIVTSDPLHFDASGRNGFDRLTDATTFEAPLLERARRLRLRIRRAGLSKYNLAEGAGPLPDPGGREAILVPGQVEGDASLRLGVAGPSDNLTLLRRTRAAFPDACLVYKPHPDVVTGLRPGHLATPEILSLADAVTAAGAIGPCLHWCDRVATFTSLSGFEALLHGKRVTTFGRPFYAGRGLTDDRDPPTGRRALSLDALTAAALILYPRYIDPRSGLPAPVEHVVDALADEARRSRGLCHRLRSLVRHAVSEILHGCPSLRPGARP